MVGLAALVGGLIGVGALVRTARPPRRGPRASAPSPRPVLAGGSPQTRIGKRAKTKYTPFGLHECRHTFASFMIDAGANAKALSVVMGHASITITFDTYGHFMPGGEQEVGRILAQYFAAV